MCIECSCPSLLHREVAKAEDTGSLVPKPSAYLQSGWRDKVIAFRDAIQQYIVCALCLQVRGSCLVWEERRQRIKLQSQGGELLEQVTA